MSKILMNKSIAWRSPSNIAIIKYWGKYGNQLPINPSISFTLSKAHTETIIHYEKKEKNNKVELEYLFENKKNEAFEKKVKIFIESIMNDFLYLKEYKLKIESKNSFPHSAGIASSASSMSALALALVDLEQQIEGKKYSENEFLQRSSYFARLGSGSASRSVFSQVALWGSTIAQQDSNQEYAISINETLHQNFKNYNDTILIVDAEQKKVSSRAGHALMNTNPFAEARKIQANKNTEKLLKVLKNGDLDIFVEICENEALSLHAMMLSSTPWYSLLKPQTLVAIEKIKNFRESTKIPVCFTLDAGPNIHILYSENNKEKVREFISAELMQNMPEARIINDKMGKGPQKIY